MHLLLSDVLAPWGQAAAIIIAIFLFVNILIGLVFSALFMFLFAWVREKAELVKKIRPNVDIVNKAIETPESVFPVGDTQQKLVQAVQRVQAIDVEQRLEHVQHTAHALSTQIEQRADRVAETMIEVRARTEMARGFLKAFFLPGLTDRYRIAELPRARLPEAASEGTDILVAESGSTDGDVRRLVEVGNERLR